MAVENTAFIILIVLIILLAIIFFVLVIRNEWVFNRRQELNRFEYGHHIIYDYADYLTMVMKFWIWDVEKFKLPKED
jgi:hypothetical protein